MSNRIKDLNPGGDVQLTDLFGVDRASPDETFNLTGQSIIDLIKNNTYIDYVEKILQNQTHLIAIADIDDNAPLNSGKFYDLFDDTNGFSQGQLDDTKDVLTSAVSELAVILPVIDGSQFTIGQEITIQGDYTTQEEYELGDASYDSKSYPVAELDQGGGVTFKTDGTKMYVVGFTNDTVYQYTLATPWDVSTASYDSKSKLVSAQSALPVSVKLSPDGTKMYVIDLGSSIVYQYTLATPWDVSTASYASKSFNTSTQTGSAGGMTFKSDGTIMMVLSNSNNTVFQYTLVTPWDVSTASYAAAKSFLFSGQLTTAYGVEMEPDGSAMFVMKSSTSTVYKYNLGTPWDVSTSVYDNTNFSASSQEANGYGLAFNDDGSKMYITGVSNDTVYQYSTVAQIPVGVIRSERRIIDNISSNDLTVLPLTNSYIISATVYRSLGTIVSNRYVMDDSYDFINIDIRYNITPHDTSNDVVAWITRDKLAGFSTEGAISIVDSVADESFTDITPSTIDVDTNIQEDTYIHSVSIAEEKITLRITMIRNSDTDDVALLKILGAID